jgi:protein-S-isoprenylcysteine O-methyltransferase Ste14
LRFEVWFRVALIALAVLLSTQPNLWRPIVYRRLIAPTEISLAAGISIGALGLGSAIGALVHLGANWGPPMTVRQNPERVTRGPSSLVRHPIYAGVLVSQLGSAMASGGELVKLSLYESLRYLGCD